MTTRQRLLCLAVTVAAALPFVSSCNRETKTDGAISGSDGAPVIVISIDTLRADHLPAYGATGLETPNIDALAKDSILFENAYAHVPLTLPSHVTMLTGLLPEVSGIRNNLGYRFDSAATPSVPTLLKAKGYATGAAVSAYVLRGVTGLAAAFDDYDDSIDRASEGGALGELQRSGDQTVAAAVRWITSKQDQPFFYMVHLFEPHAPYAPPEPFKSRYAAKPYDGEIAVTDSYVGQFLDALKSLGVYDRATIILMSDHGEGLGDHGEAQHGIFIYREAIHIPLLLKLPKGEMNGTRVKAPVQLADVLPTIAGLAGFEVPEKAKGMSLVQVARGKAPADRRIYSESMYPRIHLGWSDLASLVDARHHYIDAPRPELYDLATDVKEKQNILSDQRRVYASMRDEVRTHARKLELPQNIDPEEAAKLAALGYLGSSSSPTTGELPDPKDGIADIERIAHANGLIREGKHAEAVTLLREVLARNGSFADAWTLLAKTLDDMGRSEEALEAYKKTIEAAPMLAPGTAMSMALLYQRLGRFDDAIQHAEIALTSHPAARLVMAQSYLSKKDLAAAEREAQLLVKDPDKRDDAAVLLAQIRIAQRRFPDAMGVLDAMKSRTDAGGKQVPPNFWFARGDILARMNRIPDAERAFVEEVRLYPRNREAYVRLAVLQTLTGREADARRTFDAMLRFNPDPSSRRMAAEAAAQLKRQNAR
ncbi:MAG TPA: sulfatase-like hydrolase/transferase [Thermoanaerobaculia bacterium]|nr:sulfatase-like hydrolase/transferase [Thermoanaerobaculia bacterium]